MMVGIESDILVAIWVLDGIYEETDCLTTSMGVASLPRLVPFALVCDVPIIPQNLGSVACELA